MNATRMKHTFLREHNEDACLVTNVGVPGSTEGILLGVFDGCGGVGSGRRASDMAAVALLTVVSLIGGCSATSVVTTSRSNESATHGEPTAEQQLGPTQLEWVLLPVVLIFRPDSSTLSDESQSMLREAATSIRQRSDIRAIRVEGHADGEENPLVLSRRRAEVVLESLVSLGVPREQLEAVALGDMVPSRCHASATANCDRIAELRVGFRAQLDLNERDLEQPPSEFRWELLELEVGFDRDDASLNDEDRTILRDVVARVLSRPYYRRVRIEGLASIEEAAPAEIAHRRAEAVLEHMVGLGVPREMLAARQQDGGPQDCEAEGPCPAESMRRVRFLLLVVVGEEQR